MEVCANINEDVLSDKNPPGSPTASDHTATLMEDDAPLCSVTGGAEQLFPSKKPMSSVFRLSSGKKNRVRKELWDSLRLPHSIADELTTTSQHFPLPLSTPPEDAPLFLEAVSHLPKKEKVKKPKTKQVKKKTKSKEKIKIIKKTGEAPSGLKVLDKKKKKIDVDEVTVSNADKMVIGVALETALERNPSHDGVPLPAFFRHLIDYVEEYGLTVEGIYRVPGVNSLVQQFINTLNNGVEFPDIPPTSPTFSHYDETPKIWRDTMMEGREGRTSPPGLVFTSPPPPHDPAVVTSTLKHFLRSLPEPLLTTDLGASIEATCDQPSNTGGGDGRWYRLAELVHHMLPRVNRYLLAWLLQHMTHVIDRAVDNKMTLANLVIVFSPTLRMSHRLLALLLSQPSPDADVMPKVTETEASRLVGLKGIKSHATPHWLFSHPAFTYRPYKPPVPPPPPSSEAGFIPFDLPDSLSELEDELFKQESLLAFTHQQIASGRAGVEKDAYIWEVQHLVTKMKRKKALLELTDPEAIRAELARLEVRLERVQQELVKCEDTEGTTVGIGASLTSPEKVSKPMSSHLPVSQFDLVSPPSKRSSKQHKRRAAATAVGYEGNASGSLDAEFWELQQTATMLKRLLKQCLAKTPLPSGSPHRLVSSDSLDIVEVFNFSLRKPIANAVTERVPPEASETEAKTTQQKQSMTIEEVLTPNVESFPVEWPATALPNAAILSMKVAETGDKGPVLEGKMAQVEEEKAMMPVTELPVLDPPSQYLLFIYNYWTVRKQELLACQHDLKSRIRSQQMEISRIETCIDQMISAGKVREQQVRQYFRKNKHLLRMGHSTQSPLQTFCLLAGGNPDKGVSEDNDDEDEDDDDDDDEVDMATTLIQLMRDNERLELLNASHIENIIAERDSCAHLKVQLRLNSSVRLPSPQLNVLQ